MPAKAVITFDSLPLFIKNDNHLAEAIVGPDAEDRQTFLASIPILETRGFPKKIGFGRYRPLILEFFNRFHEIGSPMTPPGTVKAMENPEIWTQRKPRGFKRPTDKR